MSQREPASRTGRVVFIGAALDAGAAFDSLLHSDAQVVGLVTLTPEQASRTPGIVDLAQVAGVRGVPVLRTHDVNDADTVEWVREQRPDLVVCVGWNSLLEPEMLAVPTQGTVGCHASLLPRYRGSAPVCWRSSAATPAPATRC